MFVVFVWHLLGVVFRAIMSDQGERTCPLCAEEMDLTDQQLKPCKCGYEVCCCSLPNFSLACHKFGNFFFWDCHVYYSVFSFSFEKYHRYLGAFFMGTLSGLL